MKKTLLLVILFICSLLIFKNAAIAGTLVMQKSETPAETTDAKYDSSTTFKANNLSVTPLEDCYAKLEKNDVDDIKRNYLKPYRECMNRIKLKEIKEKSLSFTKKAEEKVKEPAESSNIKQEYTSFN